MSRAISSPSDAKLTVKRSKFFARAFPSATVDEARAVVKAYQTKHRRARHVCWACRVEDKHGIIVEQLRDDGEVGHPGRILLDILRRRNLLGGIVVARFFGGVKLGVGGVSRAF